MSKEFVTSVGATGSRFRISFSEEKPEQKVSKLTLSSDFTRSYEESYEDEDDVLIVDIDYGDGNVNEACDGNGASDQNGVSDRNEADSPEPIPRSRTLSNGVRKERPKFGLRRFKSVEEIIDVSPKLKNKKKLKKTASDYASRYKGLEKKEDRLTLSADFTRSYEEKFEEDDEMLVVDIDYSQGRKNVEDSFENNVFSASDQFGRAEFGHDKDFRRYRSYEDVGPSSFKHRDLERSRSGYEITFTDENAPEERKKLSLSADLSTSSEEILPLIYTAEHKRINDLQNGDDDEFFDVKNDFVTSTPQKSRKQKTELKVDMRKENKSRNQVLSVKEDDKKGSIENEKQSSTPLNENASASVFTEKPVRILDLASNGVKTEEDLEAIYDDTGMERRLLIDQKVFNWADALEGANEMKNDDTNAHDVMQSDAVAERHAVEINAEIDADVPGEVMHHDVGIDLDDIFIIDLDSNNQASGKVVSEESHPSKESYEQDDDAEAPNLNTSARAQLYVYASNQIKMDANDEIVDQMPSKVKDTVNDEDDVLSSPAKYPVKLDEKDLVDEKMSMHLQRTDNSDFETRMSLLETGEEHESEQVKDEKIDTDESPSAMENVNSKSQLINVTEIVINNGEPLGTGNVNATEDIDLIEGAESVTVDNEPLHGTEDVTATRDGHAIKKSGAVTDDNHSTDEEDEYHQSVDHSRSLDFAKEDADNDFGDEIQMDEVETKGFQLSEMDKDRLKYDVDAAFEEKEQLESDNEIRMEEVEEKGEIDKAEKDEKYFKIIIVTEVVNRPSGLDNVEEVKGKFPRIKGSIKRFLSRKGKQNEIINNNEEEVRKEETTATEYIFPWPKSIEIERKEEEDERNQIHFEKQDEEEEEEEEENKGSDEQKKNVKRNVRSRFWGFGRSEKSSKSKKEGVKDDFGHGVIPNGACKTEEEDDDDDVKQSFSRRPGSINDVISSSGWPSLVNKVYRLKDIHNGNKIFTETIRIFLQQENVFHLA